MYNIQLSDVIESHTTNNKYKTQTVVNKLKDILNTIEEDDFEKHEKQ